MKRYIRSSADPKVIADRDSMTRGRYDAALNIKWNVSDEDANRLINGVYNGESCGYLPLKNYYVSVRNDDEGVAESHGYLEGFIAEAEDGSRYYYGVADDMNHNVEYILRKGPKR